MFALDGRAEGQFGGWRIDSNSKDPLNALRRKAPGSLIQRCRHLRLDTPSLSSAGGPWGALSLPAPAAAGGGVLPLLQGLLGVGSAITAAELGVGVVASAADQERNRAALAAFFLEVPVSPFNRDTVRFYGAVRVASRERRRDALDKLIAIHALDLGFTLVTNNPRDFMAYTGVRIENRVA
jgi:tRNA(fMet)-specific endonuclease VapC